MNVDGKLVAIVGPNESGKSSFLNALVHLNERDGSIVDRGSQELTRGSSVPDDQNVVSARFLLDAADAEVISHIPEASEARWFTVTKKARVEGLWCSIEPPLVRNLQPRKHVVRSLKKTLSRQGFLGLDAAREDLDLAGSFENIALRLDTEIETLGESSVEDI